LQRLRPRLALSEASGADISYKMGQKVRNGGTVGIAHLGYLNVRVPKPEGGVFGAAQTSVVTGVDGFQAAAVVV
jgi:hypothetical protein